MKTLREFQSELIQKISKSHKYQQLTEKYKELRKQLCLEIKKVSDDIHECIDNTAEDDCESLINSYVKIPYYTDSGDLFAQIKQCGIQCKGELINAYLDMFLKNCIVRLDTDFGDKYFRIDDCRVSCSGMVFISKEEYDEIKSRLKDES